MNHQPSLDNPHIQQPLFSFTTSHSGCKKPSCHRLQSLSYSLMHLPNNGIQRSAVAPPTGYVSTWPAARQIDKMFPTKIKDFVPASHRSKKPPILLNTVKTCGSPKEHGQNLWVPIVLHGLYLMVFCLDFLVSPESPMVLDAFPDNPRYAWSLHFIKNHSFFKRTSYKNHLANVFGQPASSTTK